MMARWREEIARRFAAPAGWGEYARREQKAEVTPESERSEPSVESGSFNPGESSQRATEKGEKTTLRYTGEELKKTLQEYNMEAIRQGLPALPIELTPEQEEELVIESR